jgi:hypothetical protein
MLSHAAVARRWLATEVIFMTYGWYLLVGISADAMVGTPYLSLP